MPLSAAQVVTLAGSAAPRARLLWQDGAEGAFAWTASGIPAGWVAENLAAAARSGTAGIHLSSDIGTPAADETVQILHGFALASHGTIEFTGWMRLPTKAGTGHFNTSLFFDISAREYWPEVLWYPNSGLFTYRNSAGGYTTMTGYTFAGSDNTWYHFALTIHTTTKKYITWEFNGAVRDMANIAIQDAWAGGADALAPCLKLASSASAPADGHFDDITVRRLRTNP